MKPELTYVRGKSSDDYKLMYDCALCKNPFQFGPHVYRGQPVKAWSIMLCTSCIKDNRDGIVGLAHPDLVRYIEGLGIALKHYPNGNIAWPEVHALRF